MQTETGLMAKSNDKNINSIVAILKKEMPNLKVSYKVESLSIFGSYSRGEEKKNSDLDILVTFKETPGFFQFVRLEKHLSDLLGIKVDLVMKDALKAQVSGSITNDLVSIP